MAATSNDIARNCLAAAEEPQQASKAAESGFRMVEETATVMGRIAERVQDSAKTMDGMGTGSDQIDAMIRAIQNETRGVVGEFQLA